MYDLIHKNNDVFKIHIKINYHNNQYYIISVKNFLYFHCGQSILHTWLVTAIGDFFAVLTASPQIVGLIPFRIGQVTYVQTSLPPSPPNVAPAAPLNLQVANLD